MCRWEVAAAMSLVALRAADSARCVEAEGDMARHLLRRVTASRELEGELSRSRDDASEKRASWMARGVEVGSSSTAARAARWTSMAISFWFAGTQCC